MEDIEKFGKSLSFFLKGFLGTDIVGNNISSNNTSTESNDYNPNPLNSSSQGSEKSWVTDPYFDKWDYFPPEFRIWADINNAPKLKGGNLLVVHLTTSSCYMVDPDTEEITFLFSLKWGPRPFMWRAIADIDGHIYCSYSGTVVGYNPQAARFNYWGSIVKINHRKGTVKTLVETRKPGVGPVLDPHGMQLIGDKLLVADFQGFFDGGAIYTVDKNTGDIKIISENGHLICPVNVIKDEKNILWVANADMSEQNDGEIIKILMNGHQEVFLPKNGKDSGQLVGILQSYKQDELIIFRCEWPNVHGNSAIFSLNKDSKEVKYLFQSTVNNPSFYNTNGDISGKVLWFGESVKKEIIGYNLEDKKIIKRIDFRGVAGGARGMVDSYDGIESVTVIPDNIRELPI